MAVFTLYYVYVPGHKPGPLQWGYSARRWHCCHSVCTSPWLWRAGSTCPPAHDPLVDAASSATLRLLVVLLMTGSWHHCKHKRQYCQEHTESAGPSFLVHSARCGLDKNIVSTTAPERAVLSILSLGVALRTDKSGASKAAETCIVLAWIWLAFAGHVVLFWLWLPQHGRWTALVDSEIQRKMCEMLGISALKGYQVEALDAVCVNKRDMLVCVPTGSRNSCIFWGRPNLHLDWPCHCQRASSLVQRLWLARFV